MGGGPGEGDGVRGAAGWRRLGKGSGKVERWGAVEIESGGWHDE